ncbi:MAG: peptidylprolyl isomerase [Bryobacteraceae bacterium]
MIAHLRGAMLAAALFLSACATAPESKEAAKPPEVYRVKFETSKGEFIVEATRAWAPGGADRFHQLVRDGFYNEARFFRVLPGFVVQWGINGNPKVQELWRTLEIADDPVKESNLRGTLTYAKRGPNTRTTQVFVNLRDNARLDKDGFAPFGKVISGMEVVEQFYNAYGEVAPRGNGPQPDLIQTQGNAYIERQFPRLDFVKKAVIL